MQQSELSDLPSFDVDANRSTLHIQTPEVGDPIVCVIHLRKPGVAINREKDMVVLPVVLLVEQGRGQYYRQEAVLIRIQ